MNREIWKNNRMMKRMIALVLACVMTISIAPELISTAFAADAQLPEFLSPEESQEDAAMNTITVYRWHRVHTQADLPSPKLGRVPFLLLWEANNCIYYGNTDNDYSVEFLGDDYDACQGTKYVPDQYLPKPFDSDTEYDTFYTTKPISCWEIKMTGGTDGDNKGAKKAKIWTNGCLLRGDGDFDCGGASESGYRDTWTVYTKELGGDYGSNLSNEKPVKIFLNKSWADVGFEYTGDKILGWENYTHDYDPYAMYWAEPVKVSAITADYTIGEGMVMSIKDGVILKDGVTLTVMPGGTLSIEGQFYQNGMIKNYGTMILQPDSCVTGFLPDEDNKVAGAIYNSGEKIDSKKSTEDLLREKKAVRTELETQIRTDNQKIQNLKNAVTVAEQTAKSLLAAKDETGVSLELRLERKRAEIDESEVRVAQATATAYGVPYTASDNAKDLATRITAKAATMTDEETQKAEAAIDQTVLDEYKKLDEEYTALYKPVEDARSTAGSSRQEMENLLENFEAQQNQVKQLDAQIQKYTEFLNKNNKEVAGEGNLLIMKNARLVMNPREKSRLTITHGGSLVCSGYIIHPSSILLSDAKIHIRKGGALLAQHALEKNILIAKHLNVKNAGTIDVTFNGVSTYESLASYCVMASGNYVLKVDGVFRYVSKPVYNATRQEIVGIIEGMGAWNTDNAPQVYTDSEGSRVTINTDGSKTVVKKDGTVITTDTRSVTTTLKPGGIVIVTNDDGTSLETWPNGSYVQRFANGDIDTMSLTYDDGRMQTYSQAERAIITTYSGGVKSGTDIERTKTYVDTGRFIDYHKNSRNTECYNEDGSVYYECRQVGNELIYTYADHTERMDLKGNLLEAQYTSGELKGASIVRHNPYKWGTAAQKYWEITAANGEITELREYHEFESYYYASWCKKAEVRYYVWRFANGHTLTVDSPEEIDPKSFIYGSNLLALPLRYKYDEIDFHMPLSETEVKEDITEYNRDRSKYYYTYDNGMKVTYETVQDEYGNNRVVRSKIENIPGGKKIFINTDLDAEYGNCWSILDSQNNALVIADISNGKFRVYTVKDPANPIAIIDRNVVNPAARPEAFIDLAYN